VSELTQLAMLMYRPRWPGLTVSGQVRSYCETSPHDSAAERSGRLRLAPGGRYRSDLVDEDGERTLDISDGRSAWLVQDGEAYRADAADAVVPFTELLNPAWVLAAYQLEITGRHEHAGRPRLCRHRL
jgi:hypothetical protein